MCIYMPIGKTTNLNSPHHQPKWKCNTHSSFPSPSGLTVYFLIHVLVEILDSVIHLIQLKIKNNIFQRTHLPHTHTHTHTHITAIKSIENPKYSDRQMDK